MTSKERTIQPQAKLVPAYLGWTFAWSWGFWLLAILLKNLWPENPPMPYLIFEGLLFSIGIFGPMTASLIVLKKKSFKSISTFFFSGRKGAWLHLLVLVATITAILVTASGGRLVEGSLATLPGTFIYSAVLGGGVEEPGWRGFLQPALEKKFPFPIATMMVGIIWSLWHIPMWFYDRVYDRSQHPFLVFVIGCMVLSFWYAALYKKTRSVLACNLFHAFYNTVPVIFVGFSQAEIYADFSKINSFIYLGGGAILTLCSLYLWYKTDKKEKKTLPTID